MAPSTKTNFNITRCRSFTRVQKTSNQSLTDNELGQDGNLDLNRQHETGYPQPRPISDYHGSLCIWSKERLLFLHNSKASICYTAKFLITSKPRNPQTQLKQEFNDKPKTCFFPYFLAYTLWLSDAVSLFIFIILSVSSNMSFFIYTVHSQLLLVHLYRQNACLFVLSFSLSLSFQIYTRDPFRAYLHFLNQYRQ